MKRIYTYSSAQNRKYMWPHGFMQVEDNARQHAAALLAWANKHWAKIPKPIRRPSVKLP